MKFLAVCLLCVPLVLAVPFPKKENVTIQNWTGGRIVGGQTARAGQFPFAAALTVRTASSNFFCGGTLLTNQWIITSGNCVDGAVLFTIVLGITHLDESDSSALLLSAEDYVLHPDYNPETLENNLGLIKLRLPIQFSDYIRSVDYLPQVRLADSSAALAVGFGETDDQQTGNRNLNYVSVVSLSNAECQLLFQATIADNMVCAEGNYNEGTCRGDNGGPLIQYIERGHTMLVGVASFISSRGCESSDPSGYSRTFESVDWILQNIENP